MKGILLVMLLGVQVHAADLWVGPQEHYKSIQPALDAAKPGDVVKVLPGVYRGTIAIQRSLSLIGCKDKFTRVNPRRTPDNTQWPVILESSTAKNAIDVRGGTDNVTIEGLFVRRAGFNGIHIKGRLENDQANNPVVAGMSENVVLAGCRFENIAEDAIKVSQSNRIRIEGNLVSTFNLNSSVPTEKEHGIDFVAVSNSIVRNNYIFGNNRGIGITIKCGSINVLVEKNEITDAAWTSASVGEPSTPERCFYTSAYKEPKYYAKHIVFKENIFDSPTDLVLWNCQGCSMIDNTLANTHIIQSHGFQARSLCLQNGVKVDNRGVPTSQIRYGNCPASYPQATPVKGPRGWDVK